MEQWALWCDARSYQGVFKRRYSQVADSEFAECIRGKNGKCAKHPGITAAAVMDEVTQCIYKTCDHEGTRGTADFRSNPPSYKCTLLILKVPCDQETDFFFFFLPSENSWSQKIVVFTPEAMMCFLSVLKMLTTTQAILCYILSSVIKITPAWLDKHRCTTMGLSTTLQSSTPFLFVYPVE